MTTKPAPIRIAADHLGADVGIGTVSPNNCVTVNLDVPAVREAIESKNGSTLAILVAGLFAMFAVARFAAAPTDQRSRPNIKLPWMTDDEAESEDLPLDKMELGSRTVTFLLNQVARRSGAFAEAVERFVKSDARPHLSLVPPSSGDDAA